MVQNYRDLQVWQKAMQLTETVYHLTQHFPSQQQYIITSQIQRAALSVPANIAEGRSRHSRQDFIYHLNIARGSLAEVETFLMLAVRLGYVSESDINDAMDIANEITRMLHGLKTSLKITAKTETYNLKPETL